MTYEYQSVIAPQQEVGIICNNYAKQGWRLVSAFPTGPNSFQVMCIFEKEVENTVLLG